MEGRKNGSSGVENSFQIKTRVLPSRFIKELGVRSFTNVSLPTKEEKMNQLVPTSTFTAEYAGLPSEIAGKIVQMVKHRQACDMEDLLEACSSYTWNQVFLEVDRLSRTGELRLFSNRAGKYTVTLPAA
ncbi:MAG: hypothetical protein K0S94_831 [Nitrospira sp.]|jgi:hypothetical protein|nr:hypothetical protein [Nitrospira sp.]